jgi:hypothetical protein
MRITLLLLNIISCSLAWAQPAVKPVENKNLTLQERYLEMKAGSQTFKDYKVIKELALDNVWKVTADSIQKRKQELAATRSQLTGLQQELATVRDSVKTQQASMNDIVYDSTHISVLGIPFTKGFFLLLTVAVIGGLAVALSVVMGRMKLMNGMVKEKALIADAIANEFEEFKKKAMEKQTKLSRELQNERNKWMESRKG